MKISQMDYLQKFRCIGPDCEDTCCARLNIGLTQNDLKKLDRLVSKKRELKPFRDAYSRNSLTTPGSPTRGTLCMDEEGRCPFLDQGWCRLQRDYGETYLPLACSLYPRTYYSTRDGVEENARLSCPELARLCLLNSNLPKFGKKIDVPEDSIQSMNMWPSQGKDPYRKHLGQVRETILWILSQESFSVQERLFFCLFFAKKLNSFYYLGTEEEVDSRIPVVMNRLKNTGFLTKIKQSFTRVHELNPNVGLLMLMTMGLSFEGPQYRRINGLKAMALEALELKEDFLKSTDLDGLNILSKWEDLKRKTLLLFEDRIEMYFANFNVNIWSQALWLGRENLLMCCKFTFLSWFLARFFFFCHKNTLEAVQAWPDALQSEEGREKCYKNLDFAVVESVQIVSTIVDDNESLQESLVNALETMGIQSADDLIHLIKV